MKNYKTLFKDFKETGHGGFFNPSTLEAQVGGSQI
jgi:hypothetical protein